MAKPRTYKGTWWLPTGNEKARGGCRLGMRPIDTRGL